MNPDLINEGELRLSLHKYVAQSMINLGVIKQLAPDQVESFLQFSAEANAYQLSTLFSVPGVPLPREVVCSYPATLWDHVKAKLKWTHRRITHYRERVVTLPDYPLPHHWREGARMAIRYVAVKGVHNADDTN